MHQYASSLTAVVLCTPSCMLNTCIASHVRHLHCKTSCMCAAVRAADVIVVVSGTDGALPSVVAGLVDTPVVSPCLTGILSCQHQLPTSSLSGGHSSLTWIVLLKAHLLSPGCHRVCWCPYMVLVNDNRCRKCVDGLLYLCCR